MANSYVQYTGDGSTSLYSVTFPYLSQSHVVVKVAGVVAAYTWNSSSSITITTTPASGALIDIRRNTPSTALVTFTDGSTLTGNNLNTEALQGLYVAQEGVDIANTALSPDTADGKYNANSKVIKNVATPTNTGDATNKAYVDSTLPASVAAAASSASAANSSASAAAASATASASSATASAGSASSAATSAGVVTTNLTAINNITSNLTAINNITSNLSAVQNASANATAAASSASAASASAASASAAAASGLYRQVLDKSANYTVVAADQGTLFRTTTTSGAITYTLPLISSVTDGFKVSIVKWTSDANAVNVNRSGSDTINGGVTSQIGSQYSQIIFVADFETNTWFASQSGLGATNKNKDTFSGNGSTTVFTLTADAGSALNTDVFISGVHQDKAQYATSGTTLTFTSAPPAGTGNIEVVYGTPLAIGTPSDGTVTPAKMASGATVGNLGFTPANKAGDTFTGDIICPNYIDQYGNLRTIPQNAQTAGYTLTASDNGKHISITAGGVTVPSGVLSIGQNVVIFNNSASSQTITQGASTTLYNGGDGTSGNRTLGSRGLATVVCVASNTFVITGAGLS